MESGSATDKKVQPEIAYYFGFSRVGSSPFL